MAGSKAARKKKDFFRPLFEKVDFGHLFLSILKKMKKRSEKNLQKTRCDHNALIFIFQKNNL
jgi:hypothetical protein